MKRSDWKKRQQRRARNIEWREKAERSLYAMWQTDRMLTPSKPHSYAVRARCRRIWKKLEKQKQANLPHRITEAVREPLIRYQKWMRGELEDIELHEEDAFQDPRRFLIHWLMDIEDAASGSLDPSSLEPIRDLRRFLDDLLTGARSDLKDRFVRAQKAGKGRSRDPWPIAHHKLAVGLCYKLLTGVAFYKKKHAIQILKLCLKRRGLPVTGQIPDLARKVSQADLPLTMRALAEDSGLSVFLTIFISCLQGSTIYEYPNFDQMIEAYRNLVNENCISQSDWENIVDEFGRDNWQMLDEKSRQELLFAWFRSAKLACHVIFGLCSSKPELLRFHGYTSETSRDASEKRKRIHSLST